MKAIGSMVEQQFRSQMIEGRRALFFAESHRQLREIIFDKLPGIENMIPVGFVPEQGEDIVSILVSPDLVLQVEIPKDGSPPLVKLVSTMEYMKRSTKHKRIKMKVADDLIRENFSAQGSNP